MSEYAAFLGRAILDNLNDLKQLDFADGIEAVNSYVQKSEHFVQLCDIALSLPEFQAQFGDNLSQVRSWRQQVTSNLPQLETYQRKTAAFHETLNSLHRVPIETEAAFSVKPVRFPRFEKEMIWPISGHTADERLGAYYCIDVETTGLDPAENEIVQLAAVRFLAFSPVDCFVSYIKPKHGINADSAKINGITNETVSDAPCALELIKPFRSYVGERIPIVGHNIAFDMQFLCNSGFLLPNRYRHYFDTLGGSRKAYKLSCFRLDYLDKVVLNIDRRYAHDALSDALITGYLFRDLVLRKRSST